MLRNLESRSNPWGQPQSQRADWAKGLDVPRRERQSHPSTSTGSGAPARSTSGPRTFTSRRASCSQRAGVSFAILGPRELCTGDPARRMGNEFLFQTLAEQNVETMNEVGVTKVIANCPHCFNTLRNEYPQYGGSYEVIHHTELLARLVADGRLHADRGGRDAARVPRPVLPGAPQPGVRRAPRRARRGPGVRDGGDAAAQGTRDVLRRRRRADVDGGSGSASASTPSGRTRRSRRAPTRSEWRAPTA